MSMQSGAGSGGGVMTPVNPIVGGTSLRIPAIQSPNYVHGSTGWAIFADGTAEFAGLVVNGGTIVLAGSDGTQVALLVSGGTAQQQITPPTEPGITWVPATLAGFFGAPYPLAPVQASRGAVVLAAPVDAGGGDHASITLFGGIAGAPLSQILQRSDQVFVLADNWSLLGNTGPTTTATINGDLTVSGTLHATDANIRPFTLVGTTDASGNYDLGAALCTAFGWATVTGAAVWNGDGTLRPNTIVSKVVGGSYGASWTVNVKTTGGANVTGANYRFDGVAVGHP